MRFILVLNLFILIASSWSSANEHLLLLIDGHTNDKTGHGVIKYDDALTIIDAGKQFPHSKPVILGVKSNADLKAQLSQLSRSSPVIDGLIIMAHGESFSQVEYNFIEKRPIIAFPRLPFASVIFSEDFNLDINLLDVTAVENSLGPILPFLGKNVSVVFTSCSLLAAGTTEEKFQMAKIVAENLRINSGQIFLAGTVTGRFNRTLLEEPYWQGENWQKIAGQVSLSAWQFALPLYYLMDHFIINSGFTLKMDSHSIRFYRDHLFNAMVSPVPTGQAKGPIYFEKSSGLIR